MGLGSVAVCFSAEFAEAVFDGAACGLDGHVEVDGFHFGCMELKQAQLCIDTFVGAQCYHVCLEV